MVERWQNGKMGLAHRIAVAIQPTEEGRRHLGLIHFHEEHGESCLHYEWHERLTNEASSAAWWIVCPPLGVRAQIRLAARCRQVIKANGAKTLPYGFGSPKESFDPETSQYRFPPNELGLTCATFVMAIFDMERMPLLKEETWPSPGRKGDPEWQEWIVGMLAKHPRATPEYVEFQRQKIGKVVRFRPEEVTAAASLPARPVEFAAIKDISEEILKVLFQVGAA